VDKVIVPDVKNVELATFMQANKGEQKSFDNDIP